MNLRDLYRDLIPDNPLMIEARRAQRNFFRPGTTNSMQVVGIVILGLAYAFFALLFISFWRDAQAVWITYVIMVIVVLLVPSMCHAAIAGEREKKSLELLQAAPLTSAQIVAAKAMRALPSLGVLILAGLAPALVILALQGGQGPPQNAHGAFSPDIPAWWRPIVGFGEILGNLLVCLVTGYLIAGVSLYISSLVNTQSAALVATVGVLLVALGVWPALTAVFAATHPDVVTALNFLHPFGTMVTLQEWLRGNVTNIEYAPIRFLLTLVLFPIISTALLYFATFNVDRERRQGRLAATTPIAPTPDPHA